MPNNFSWSAFDIDAEKQSLTDFLFSRWDGLAPTSISALVDMCFNAGWDAMPMHVHEVDTEPQEKERTAFLKSLNLSDTAEYLDAVGTLLTQINYSARIYNYELAAKDYSYDEVVASLTTRATLLLGDEVSMFLPKGLAEFIEKDLVDEDDAIVDAWVATQKFFENTGFTGMRVSGTFSLPFAERVCVASAASAPDHGRTPLEVVVGALMGHGALCRSHTNAYVLQQAIDSLDVRQPPTTDGTTLILPDVPLFMAMARYCAGKMDESNQRSRLQLGGTTLTTILDNSQHYRAPQDGLGQ